MPADDVQRWHDHLPGRPQLPQPSRQTVRRTVIGTGLVAYSWVAGSTAPFSTKALLSVLFPGVVLAVIAYGWHPERIPPPEHLDVTGFSYWVICVAALFEWEAAAFKDNSRWWHPSLTDLVNPIIAPHPMKSAAILVWLLAGWGLVRR
jgi:hypothetical protein